LVPLYNPPRNHLYIGPILWSPPGSRPTWWDEVPRDRPWVYVTFGSSGRVDVLGGILDALRGLKVSVVVATAGRVKLDSLPDNVWVSEYLPGEEAAGRAALVICNGSSGAVAQALNAGVPVLGLPSNIDQYMVMRYVQEAGAGIGLRSDLARVKNIRAAIETLFDAVSYRQAASALADEFRRYNAKERFGRLLDQWLV
jgi:UDP:flavonoid glycosyltransferase YjiC (YdhE family)